MRKCGVWKKRGSIRKVVSKVRTRRQLKLKLKVKIITEPATIAGQRAWAQFWQRLLRERAVSATNKDNGGEGSQAVRL